jgi:hypothetical protein
MSFLLYLNNFHGQNVKPCSRTTRILAGLNYLAQKGRRTLLDGAARRYLASRIPFFS